MNATLSRRRALVLTAGMGAAAALGSVARPTRLDDAQPPPDLEQIFPSAFGAWRVEQLSAAFIRPANDLSKRLYQRLLERVYTDSARRRVMLSVAWGSEQSSNLQLHWPEVCYRYSGFAVHGRHQEQIMSNGRSVPVTRLVAEMPLRPEPVTYWAVLSGERTADANTFRLRRLAHAVRHQSADGLLVRVSSIDADAQRGFALHAEFIDALSRALSPADLARVEGTLDQT
ncbi:exosortase C-terminal domain/associated protein EpsI [Rivibacter subsaxonicus]|uniref:EpsI family protein n=1 Tax=Rivibacter subsaxonicus TaxID=457575 RepID=A0A4Q7VP84_9BURK|nr:exosortase C-terminal domain/associated protein EpsI [Rivibacter subsaxonicus]RZT98152.1 EpsI family protein [Rivibacter subsaxonicus]